MTINIGNLLYNIEFIMEVVSWFSTFFQGHKIIATPTDTLYTDDNLVPCTRFWIKMC